MGSIYRFTCSSCGYEAEVSGRADYGQESRTETVVCRGCRDLFDIVVGSTDDGEPLSRRGVDEFGQEWSDLTEEAQVIQPRDSPPKRAPKGKRCPECRSRRLFIWSGSDGCPQCGSAMTRDGPTIMWD